MEKRFQDLLKYAVFVILAIIGAYYLFNYFSQPTVDIRKFTGNVASIDGEVIKLHGIFVGPPAMIPKDISSSRDFSFRTDETTQFEKVDIGWPTWEEVQAAPGGHLTFKVEELTHIRGEGSLDDLKNLSLSNPGAVYVEANFRASIYNSKNPAASSVLYRLLTMPLPSRPTPTP